MSNQLKFHQDTEEHDVSKNETVRLNVKKQSSAIALNKTKGDKVLKALVKLQQKLNVLQLNEKGNVKSKSGHSDLNVDNDELKINGIDNCNKSILVQTDDDKHDNESNSSNGNGKYDNIETRLLFIEKQLQFIIEQMKSNSNKKVINEDETDVKLVNKNYGYKVSASKSYENLKKVFINESSLKTQNDPFKSTLKTENNSFKSTLKTQNDLFKSTSSQHLNTQVDLIHYPVNQITKNKYKELENDNPQLLCNGLSKTKPSKCKHYRLQMKDVPFLLGTVS